MNENGGEIAEEIAGAGAGEDGAIVGDEAGGGGMVDGGVLFGANPDQEMQPDEGEEDYLVDLDGDVDFEQLGIDPDISGYLGNKGFKSIGDVLQSYVEQDTMIGRQGDELGDVKQQLAKLEGMVQTGGMPQQQQQAQPRLIRDDLPAYKDDLLKQVAEGTLDMEVAIDKLSDAQQAAYDQMLQLQGQATMQQVREEFGPKLQAAEYADVRHRWQNEANEMLNALGSDEYERLWPAAQRYMEGLPENERVQPGLWQRGFQAAMFDDQLAQRRREAASVPGVGGNGAAMAPPDPQEITPGEILNAIGGSGSII